MFSLGKTRNAALALATMIAAPSAAELCTVDAVPAATLLLPIFEVDIGLCDGAKSNTSMRLRNASPTEPALAHVRLWTDLGSSLFAFNMYLPPGAERTADPQELFCNGTLPDTRPGTSTASNPVDESISLVGCTLVGTLTAASLTSLIEYHTGRPFGGKDKCLGSPSGNIATGYLTIDNVNRCDPSLFPGHDDYFHTDGTGVANHTNQLWGDWFMIDDAQGFAFGDNLVSVEAAPDTSAFGPNDYTFYGRYFSQTGSGQSGADQREPLATTWATRYFKDGSGAMFEGGTDLLVWRGPQGQLGPGKCSDFPQRSAVEGAVPSLPPAEVTFVSSSGVTIKSTLDLPWAVNRVHLSDHPDLPGSEGIATFDLSMADNRHSFVIALGVSGDGDLTNLDAQTVGIACQQPIPLFSDGFESGNTSAWSSKVP